MASLPKVFLCYARSDNRHDDPRHRWLDRVRTHLKAYRRSFEVFHDSNLEGGEAWEKLILQQAAECHVAILLISGPFLASDFIVQRELPILLRRWQAGEVLLLPLLISECAVDHVDVGFPDPSEGPEFIKLSAIQQPGGTLEALSELQYNTQEKKLSDTASKVHRHVQSLVPKAVAGPSTSTAPAPAPASTSNPVPKSKVGGAPGDIISVDASLAPPSAGATLATPDRPWINSLDMRFVAVPGTRAWFSVWPTRVRDYRAFAEARGGMDGAWRDPMWEGVPVTPGPDHPVVHVSWNDAQEFCRWLTDREHRKGRLKTGQRYRLPTDREWSAAVGLPEEPGKTPKYRDQKIVGVYPWGTQWPPPRGAGNFADVTFKKRFGGGWTFIEGYDDGFATTSPVGSFQPSPTGLHDLSGNVWEWCEDLYAGSGTRRVLRGGSWYYDGPRGLLSSYRGSDKPDERYVNFGFRVVLGVDEPAR